jgi:hypothetical protein
VLTFTSPLLTDALFAILFPPSAKLEGPSISAEGPSICKEVGNKTIAQKNVWTTAVYGFPIFFNMKKTISVCLLERSFCSIGTKAKAFPHFIVFAKKMPTLTFFCPMGCHRVR